MADEVASAALSTGQKAVEVSLELIKMLAPLAGQLVGTVFRKSVDGINFLGEKISDAKAAGTVSGKALLAEAEKAGSPVMSTSNFLARDAERIAEKAKEYDIPIAIIGSGEKQTIEFLERDKAAVEQIMNEVVQERVQGAPQSVKCFSMGENNAGAMKKLLEENGIECQMVAGKDGKVTCIYPAECAEQVAVLKDDYKQLHKEVATQFEVKKEPSEVEGCVKITVTDKVSGETRSADLDPNDPRLNQQNMASVFQNNFGYSPAKAEIAANKFAYELGLDKAKYFARPTQEDNIEGLMSNIRYASDDVTLRETRFDAVQFKDGENAHILLNRDGKSVALTPAAMTEQQMKDLCVDKLGMTEQQAKLAVDKAVKIESQMRSQIAERTVDKSGVSLEANIERTSRDSFNVTIGGRTETYDLTSAKTAGRIAQDFGIPRQSAENIVAKAKKQSALQNKINNLMRRKKRPTAAKPPIEFKGKKR